MKFLITNSLDKIDKCNENSFSIYILTTVYMLYNIELRTFRIKYSQINNYIHSMR